MSEINVALGIIGGSGLYSFEGLENRRTVIIDTPFGLPSSPIILGEVHGKQLAFLEHLVRIQKLSQTPSVLTSSSHFPFVNSGPTKHVAML